MNTNALIALLVIVGIIVIVNFAMFGIVRGMTRGDHRWMNALRDTLSKPMEKSNQPYDELRRQMRELSGEEKKEDSNRP